MTHDDPQLRRALNRATLLFAVAIALIGAAVRLPRLSVFLTPDETRWACRSVNFYGALAVGDLASTYQKEHPGVITMWLGGLGQPVDPNADWAKACRDIPASKLVADAPRPALDAITARLFRGRVRIALFVCLGLALMVWLLARLFDRRVALIAGLIVALDPFYVAHSRVLHLDGVTTTLMTLSLLALLVWRHDGRRRRDLLLSGVLAGLAAVNKSPGLFLAPVAGLVIGVDALLELRRRLPPGRPGARFSAGALRQAVPLALDIARPLALWSAAAVAAYVAVWPAMWVAPLASLRNVLGGAESYAAEGHEGGNYFWGRFTNAPGPAFYPVAWALRTTPVTMLGLVLAAWFAWRRPPVPADKHAGAAVHTATPVSPLAPTITPSPHPSLAFLLAYALLFALLMSGGAKKFDRYLLPVFPAVDILAGWGIATALVAWGARQARRKGAASLAGAAVLAEGAVAMGALVVAWSLAFILFAHRPYFLDWYNPLAGGQRAGEWALLLGWGEGLDQAADWLNAQPNAAEAEVATRYRSALGPLLKGHALEMNKIDVATVDHYLFYRNQLQRSLDPELIERFFGPQAPIDRAPTPIVTPDLVINLGALQYGWLFANRNWEATARFIDERADVKRDAVLVRAASGFAHGYTGPLDVIEVDPNAGDADVARVIGDAFVAHERLWWVRYDDLVPYPGLARVDDVLALSAYRTADDDTGEVRVARFDRAADTPAVIAARSRVAATADLTATHALTEPIGFTVVDADRTVSHDLVLHGIDLPDRPAAPGRALQVAVRWGLLSSTKRDYTLFIHLLGPDGRRIAQDDHRLVDASGQPTSAWTHVPPPTTLLRALAIPAGTPPGPYTLLVGTYEAATGNRAQATPLTIDGDLIIGHDRLPDDVLNIPIEVGRAPVAFDDSALGLTHGAIDAPVTIHANLYGFDAARPVEAGGTAAVGVVWRGGDAHVTYDQIQVDPATIGPSPSAPAFVHVRITDTLGANVGDLVAPLALPSPWEWRDTDRLKQTFDVPIYGRALAGEGLIRFEWLNADKHVIVGEGPDHHAAVTAPFTIDGPLRIYDLPPDVPAKAKRDVTFGTLAKLRAAEVAATRVDAGAPLTVTMWWEALAQNDAPYLVDLGLLDDDGHVLASEAANPADGRRMTTSWLTGEIVRDGRIVVPDAAHRGRLTLAVRLTAADGGAPVAAEGEGAGLTEGWVRLAEVVVR